VKKQGKATTPKSKWQSLSEKVHASLTAPKVTQVTSVTPHGKTVSEKFNKNINRLISGEFEAKRRAGQQAYWAEYRKTKMKREKSKEARVHYLERHSLAQFSCTLPTELHEAFRNHCKQVEQPAGVVITEIILEFLTRPKKS
jgi:hypothetical protein